MTPDIILELILYFFAGSLLVVWGLTEQVKIGVMEALLFICIWPLVILFVIANNLIRI